MARPPAQAPQPLSAADVLADAKDKLEKALRHGPGGAQPDERALVRYLHQALARIEKLEAGEVAAPVEVPPAKSVRELAEERKNAYGGGDCDTWEFVTWEHYPNLDMWVLRLTEHLTAEVLRDEPLYLGIGGGPAHPRRPYIWRVLHHKSPPNYHGSEYSYGRLSATQVLGAGIKGTLRGALKAAWKHAEKWVEK